jgi:hypothetical protein
MSKRSLEQKAGRTSEAQYVRFHHGMKKILDGKLCGIRGRDFLYFFGFLALLANYTADELIGKNDTLVDRYQKHRHISNKDCQCRK